MLDISLKLSPQTAALTNAGIDGCNVTFRVLEPTTLIRLVHCSRHFSSHQSMLFASADYFTEHFCGAHTCAQKERQARLQTVDQVCLLLNLYSLMLGMAS